MLKHVSPVVQSTILLSQDLRQQDDFSLQPVIEDCKMFSIVPLQSPFIVEMNNLKPKLNVVFALANANTDFALHLQTNQFRLHFKRSTHGVRSSDWCLNEVSDGAYHLVKLGCTYTAQVHSKPKQSGLTKLENGLTKRSAAQPCGGLTD